MAHLIRSAYDPHPVRAALRTGLRGAGLLLVLWVAVASALVIVRGPVPGVAASAPATVLAAFALYASGHLLRIVRLMLLLGNARLSVRRLAAFHFFTSGVGLAAPLRLGDVFRAVELGSLTGGVVHGITFVWIERVLDAVFLTPMLVLLIFLTVGELPDAAGTYGGFVLTIFSFVAASVVLVALVPDNLRRVGTYMIRRYERPWTLLVLRGIDEIRAAARRVPLLLRGKLASLLALSMLIWLFELASFAVALLSWEPGANPFTGLLAFLSQTAGGALPAVLASLGRQSLAYQTYIAAALIPLAFAALAGGLYYWRSLSRRKTA